MEVYEKIKAVSSKKDLPGFIMELREDLIKNPEKWENITLEAYLEAMSGWVADMDGYFIN